MIYLDNNATTPLHPKVKEKIINFLDFYGNPSSVYEEGRKVRAMVEEARENIADFLNCDSDEIIFTAGGSEANNTVIKGATSCCAFCNTSHTHIISSVIEHPSVMNTLECLEKQNVEVTYLPVDKYGLINPKDVENAIKENTSLITIMYANNETGTIQPIEEIIKIARENNIQIHTDAVQAIGKIPIDLQKLDVDYLSLSGHKIYAPKGIGVLFHRKGKKPLCPLISGGHQENSMRAGTENTIGIIGLGEAVIQLKIEMDDEVKKIKFLRDKLENELKKNISNISINGHLEKRLPGVLNVSFNNIEGESILLRLDMHGISISTGSACSSGSLEPSYVITALNVPPEQAHSSIRFSLGRENTEEDIDKTIIAVKETVEFLRSITAI
ncbi:MAG: cysteine desulfurase family protein [Candidatus Marinimicrobia bacterium]|nr:cysteine desulfurase family protein [Candidatus Neomarinimicrobiota bacterium]